MSSPGCEYCHSAKLTNTKYTQHRNEAKSLTATTTTMSSPGRECRYSAKPLTRRTSSANNFLLKYVGNDADGFFEFSLVCSLHADSYDTLIVFYWYFYGSKLSASIMLIFCRENVGRVNRQMSSLSLPLQWPHNNGLKPSVPMKSLTLSLYCRV